MTLESNVDNTSPFLSFCHVFVIINGVTIPYFSRLNIFGMILSCVTTLEGQISNVIQKVYFSLSRLRCTASFTSIETQHRLVVTLWDSILHIIPVQGMSTESLVLSTSLIMSGVGVTLDKCHTFRMCSFFLSLLVGGGSAYLLDKLLFARSSRCSYQFFNHNNSSCGNLPLKIKSARIIIRLNTEIFSRSINAFADILNSSAIILNF
jgi:hypothetical protein